MFHSPIRFQNPGMLISDIAVAIACLYCYFDIKISTKNSGEEDLKKFWKLFFLFESISFLIGGLSHGLVTDHSTILSMLSFYLSIAGVLFFTMGILAASYGSINKWHITLLFSGAIASAVITTILNSFSVIIIYCFSIMFIIALINQKNRIISFKTPCSKGILLGTLLFIIASVFFVFNIQVLSIESGVISHIIIAVGILLFGNGCRSTIISEHYKNTESYDDGVQKKSIKKSGISVFHTRE